jgi:hypothetical protein
MLNKLMFSSIELKFIRSDIFKPVSISLQYLKLDRNRLVSIPDGFNALVDLNLQKKQIGLVFKRMNRAWVCLICHTIDLESPMWGYSRDCENFCFESAEAW